MNLSTTIQFVTRNVSLRLNRAILPSLSKIALKTQGHENNSAFEDFKQEYYKFKVFLYDSLPKDKAAAIVTEFKKAFGEYDYGQHFTPYKRLPLKWNFLKNPEAYDRRVFAAFGLLVLTWDKTEKTRNVDAVKYQKRKYTPEAEKELIEHAQSHLFKAKLNHDSFFGHVVRTCFKKVLKSFIKEQVLEDLESELKFKLSEETKKRITSKFDIDNPLDFLREKRTKNLVLIDQHCRKNKSTQAAFEDLCKRALGSNDIESILNPSLKELTFPTIKSVSPSNELNLVLKEKISELMQKFKDDDDFDLVVGKLARIVNNFSRLEDAAALAATGEDSLYGYHLRIIEKYRELSQEDETTNSTPTSQATANTTTDVIKVKKVRVAANDKGKSFYQQNYEQLSESERKKLDIRINNISIHGYNQNQQYCQLASKIIESKFNKVSLRLYYYIDSKNSIVLLNCSNDKDNQQNDINNAEKMMRFDLSSNT